MFRLANSTFAAVAALPTIVIVPANAQGPLVAWGGVSYTPSGTFSAVAAYTGFFQPFDVAIRADGTLVAWGGDSFGQVSGTPAGTFSAVSVGEHHAVALRTDGTLVSWGSDAHGQVSGTPAGTFSAVAAGGAHTVAIRTDGTLASWGSDYWTLAPVEPPPAGTFTAVDAGLNTSVAIRTDGTLAIWGATDFGGVPTAPAGTFLDIATSGDNTVGIRTDGTLVSWGLWSSSPPAGTYIDVAAGASHSVAIATDGTLVSWGDDSFGQVSNTPTGTFSAVAAGTGYSLAIADPGGNEPPVITCNNPVVLWSPNHELVDAGSAFSVDDPDGDPVNVTIRVFSDETEIPDTGDGTGRHAPDFKSQLASGAAGLFLRSERRGNEDGRFYLGLITADDGQGGITEQVCILAVCPHDQNNPSSLDHVLGQAAAAATALDFPTGLSEHGLSAPLGPHQ